MAFIGLRVPHETSRLLKQIDLMDFGDAEPMDTAHITLLNMGKNCPIEILAQAVQVGYQVASKTKPFTVQTSRAGTFAPNDKGEVPMIALMDSSPLHSFHRDLKEAFDAAGIEYSKKFPVFKPHVTLGYSNDPLVYMDHVFDVSFSTIEWGAHEAVLWGGDHGDERLVTTFPFAINPFREAVQSAMTRAAHVASHTEEHVQEARIEARVFAQKLDLLSRAAEAAGDTWMATFAKDMASRMSRSPGSFAPSEGQQRKIKSGFQRFRDLMSRPAEIQRLLQEKKAPPQDFVEEERIRDLRIKILKLRDMAANDGDNWVRDFAINMDQMVRNKRPLSGPQAAALEKAFKKFRL